MNPDFDDTVAVDARELFAKPGRRSAASALNGTVPGGTALDDTALDDTILTGTPAVAPPNPSQPPTPPHRQVAGPASAFYRFRIGQDGPVTVLDSTVHIGRKPNAPRIATGAAPRLVQVQSPRGEVSATHLEISQLGATVIVTDLKSTNGSLVLMPGGDPLALRRGESVVVSPGTIVDIGDGNIIEILPMQRLETTNETMPEGHQ